MTMSRPGRIPDDYREVVGAIINADADYETGRRAGRIEGAALGVFYTLLAVALCLLACLLAWRMLR